MLNIVTPHVPSAAVRESVMPHVERAAAMARAAWNYGGPYGYENAEFVAEAREALGLAAAAAEAVASAEWHAGREAGDALTLAGMEIAAVTTWLDAYRDMTTEL